STGAISVAGALFRVSGDHTYGEEGTFTITTSIDHEGVASSAIAASTVADPAVSASAASIAATEGTAFTGTTVATFIDPGGVEPNAFDPSGVHYTATIDWGDGSALQSGTITESGGTFSVTGNHTYGEEGTYTVTTTINHEGV